MALAEVIDEVRTGADRRAQEILDAARSEADAILGAAREEAERYEQARLAQVERDAGQLEHQHASHAAFEARKLSLVAESELRQEMRSAILAGFADLPSATRKKHIAALLKQAKDVVPKGTVFGAKKDADLLADPKPYKLGKAVDIAGGIIVESADGSIRIDLSYETLLDGMWRDILRSESELFA